MPVLATLHVPSQNVAHVHFPKSGAICAAADATSTASSIVRGIVTRLNAVCNRTCGRYCRL